MDRNSKKADTGRHSGCFQVGGTASKNIEPAILLQVSPKSSQATHTASTHLEQFMLEYARGRQAGYELFLWHGWIQQHGGYVGRGLGLGRGPTVHHGGEVAGHVAHGHLGPLTGLADQLQYSAVQCSVV